MAETYAVGKEVVCYCGKCRMDIGHTITAVAKGQIAKVICRTCRSDHIYRGKKGITEPLKVGEDAPYQKDAPVGSGTRKRVGTTSAKPKAVAVEVEWQNQMNNSAKPIRSYAADQSFKLGDKISHPTFGMGIIQKIVYPNKIEILFQMDLKTLIHKPA